MIRSAAKDLVGVAVALAMLLGGGPALAQATVNPGALDALAPAPDATAPDATVPANPAKPRPARKHPQPRPARKPAPKQAAPVKLPAPEPPAVPASPPPAPVLPPPLVVPVRPTSPPPPPPIAADAPGEALSRADGVRVTFGPSRADLNPATNAALRALIHGAAPDAQYGVDAYAAGNADDPSTSRRLSLSRALAIRDTMIAEAVDSRRITVRALGATGAAFADGPPDRADIMVRPASPKASGPPDTHADKTP